MKNVLYIGNALSDSGKTKTTIETLSQHLNEFCSVKIASKKKNKVLRLIDMINLIVANRSKTDYVLIDTYSTTNFYYALIISQLCRFFSLKYIPILHGGNLENRLKNNAFLSDLIFKNAFRLVAPSPFLESVFRTYGYTNIIHIPNSIEISNYTFQNRPIDKIRLLWVRSFSLIYNPNLAIEVLHNLVSNGYNAELTMIGPDVDGSLNNAKALASNYKLNVNFTGKLTKKQWITTSKDFNIFLNTTNFDNMPVSVIEAMALGLPVVSTNVGGIPFLVKDRLEALLVPPHDENAMVNAILELKNDENLRNRLLDNARTKAESFDWNNVKPKWKSLLS